MLAGRAPISVFTFPKIAETIVYIFLRSLMFETHDFEKQNNSITGSTLRDLATQIEHSCPELIGTLREAGKDAGVTGSITTQTVPRLENDIANIFQVLGTILKAIPQDLPNTTGSSE